MMQRQKKLINLIDLEEYTKCPLYHRFNLSNRKLTKEDKVYKAYKQIIIDTYQHLQFTEKKLVWKTIRNKVHENFSPLLKNEELSIDKYFKLARKAMGELRNWYLKEFRDGPTTCLTNLVLESSVPATAASISGEIDAILLATDHVRIIEISNNFNSFHDILTSIALRTKVWLLYQQDIKVNEIVILNIDKESINIYTYPIQDFDSFIYETEARLRLITLGISNNIYYASNTIMCKTCQYKPICKG